MLIETNNVLLHEYHHTNLLYVDYTDMPHIISFSGGRSSGMLALEMCRHGQLKPERGDCILFQNTSAEHPATYDFVQQFKDYVESNYNVPLYLLEFATYQRKAKGKNDMHYILEPSFRLVDFDCIGYQNRLKTRGEVYELMLSYKGMVPSLWHRLCTVNLKIKTMRSFILEHLTTNDTICPRGDHFENKIDVKVNYERYHSKESFERYKAKRDFALSQPAMIQLQSKRNFTKADVMIERRYMRQCPKALHKDHAKGMQILVCLGLRFDPNEQKRVNKILPNYNTNTETSKDFEGEYIACPLHDNQITKADVIKYWKRQPFDLQLPVNGLFSNCTFCFLKGERKLKLIAEQMRHIPDELKDTPSDINWWIAMEQKYGRHVADSQHAEAIGFFGLGSDYAYPDLLKDRQGALFPYDNDEVSCQCTN